MVDSTVGVDATLGTSAREGYWGRGSCHVQQVQRPGVPIRRKTNVARAWRVAERRVGHEAGAVTWT